MRSHNGVMWMVLHGSSFMDIKEKWLTFRDEPRNVKILLEDNGVDLSIEMRSIYLVWSIFILNNNMYPWMLIKKDHAMLSLIVPSIYFQLFTTYHLIFIIHYIV
jgi:hypothetical protein